MVKMRTREEAVMRYGAVDLTSKLWPDAALWLKPLVIPEGRFPNWRVMDTQIPVRHIFCNSDIHLVLQASLDAIVAANLQNELKTFDGCQNVRCVRGRPNDISAHAWGLAIDINVFTNPMSSVLHTDMSPAFVRCFKSNEARWGGDFLNRKDPQHISWAGWE